jgi:hypothetical protein
MGLYFENSMSLAGLRVMVKIFLTQKRNFKNNLILLQRITKIVGLLIPYLTVKVKRL